MMTEWLCDVILALGYRLREGDQLLHLLERCSRKGCNVVA